MLKMLKVKYTIFNVFILLNVPSIVRHLSIKKN